MSVALDRQPSLVPAASLHGRQCNRDVISAKLRSWRSHALLHLRGDVQQTEHLHGCRCSWLRSLCVLFFSVACIWVQKNDLCRVVEHALVQRQLITTGTLPRQSARATRCAWNLSRHRTEQRIQSRERIARIRHSKELILVGQLLFIIYIHTYICIYLLFCLVALLF